MIMLISCQKNTGTKELRSPGEIAFRSHCQTCHVLPKPTMKTDDEWPALVARYGKRAKISEEEKKDIISYLTANN